MALQSISAAMKSIPSKKDELRKAFENVQAQSSAVSSFTLKWKDLEEHLDSIKESIERRFEDLLAMERQKQPDAADMGAAAMDSQPSDSAEWPELKTLCSNMDSKGLRAFILARRQRKDGLDMRSALESAMRCASDPVKLVLDAIEGYHSGNSKGDNERAMRKTFFLAKTMRSTCLLLLERLAVVSPTIKESAKERAKNMALEWKGKAGEGGDIEMESLTFLQLLATFGLASAFKADELMDIFVIIARRRQAVDLCKVLGLEGKVPVLIEKLISKGKQLDAINFAYAFQLVDKYPPVPLLKAYVNEIKKTVQEVRKKGNHSTQSLNEATDKEIAALRATIKSVEDHNLKSEYSCDEHEKRIAMLEKQKADRKRAAAVKSQQQQPANKRQRQDIASADAVMLPQHQQPSGLLVNSVNSHSFSRPYPGSGTGGIAGSANIYGMDGLSGAAPTSPYSLTGGPGSSVTYGVANRSGSMLESRYEQHLNSRPSGSHLAYGGNPRSSMSQLTADALSSSLYDKPTGYGYSLPHKYDTSYYSSSHHAYGGN